MLVLYHESACDIMAKVIPFDCMANDEGLFSNFLMFNGDFDQSLFVCLFVFALSNMLSAFLINFSSLLGFRR